MIRKPAAAGTFYPSDKKSLIEEIERSFIKGVGRIPEVRKGRGKIKGIVVPHAGYIYSGYVAAYSYNEIAKGFPSKFIIIGPNHTGYGSPVAIMTEGEWETPLGRVKISEDSKNYFRGIIDSDELAHKYEHSIEVQLPFLQYLNSDFEFTPICLGMQDYETAIEVGEIIADAEDAIIIASTDFSHVGFSKFPSRDDIKRDVEDRDNLAIKKILDMDERGLIELVEEKNITMCGYGGVAAMLHAAKIRGAKKARLLKYATSYDVQPGTYCVGYAAIVVE